MVSTRIIRAAWVAAVIAASFALVVLSGCGPSYKVYAQRINSTSVAERRAVAKELRGAKRDAKLVPVILQACQDQDADVRMYAYFAIGKADPREEGVVAAVLAGMADTVVDVRRAVAASLGELSPFPNNLLPPMVKMLIDPDERTRTLIINAFTDLEGAGVGSLLRHLDTKDVNLRLAVVNVLGMVGSPAKNALARLKSMSKEDDDLRIREAAERAVGRIER
jgi:HEAT repeat protein